MEIPFELPVDSDGYLRRQCPRCARPFKWFHDQEQPAEQLSELILYYCPYCGEPSSSDQWWTDEQVDYAQGLASIEAMRLVERELRPVADSFTESSEFLKIELEVPRLVPPTPLFESDDMIAVEPPCHPDEPIKVVEEWGGELHCLRCGKTFIVSE